LKDSTNILIEGESGTGKELIAEYLGSIIAPGKPFIVVNCPAIPSQLIESILFGHVKGAFTGADKETCGKFETAKDGVIFLDEISSAPLSLQKKLLRILQSGEYEKTGSSKKIKCNVKIIAATNENLEEKVKDNEFREDLFYRLNRHKITIPPLRNRPEDIPLLVKHFMKDEHEKLSGEVIKGLICYSWPGNVRELENTIADLLIRAKNRNKIVLKDISPLFNSFNNIQETDKKFQFINEAIINNAKIFGLKNCLQEVEKEIVNSIIEEYKIFRKCSSVLKIDPSVFTKKVKKIDKKSTGVDKKSIL